jgi:hypothetical protein
MRGDEGERPAQADPASRNFLPRRGARVGPTQKNPKPLSQGIAVAEQSSASRSRRPTWVRGMRGSHNDQEGGSLSRSYQNASETACITCEVASGGRAARYVGRHRVWNAAVERRGVNIKHTRGR